MKLEVKGGRWGEQPGPARARPEAPLGDDRWQVGQVGEALAAAHLESCGFRVLARNWRRREGELDIVAVDGERLVFVEVRALRGGRWGRPEETVGAAKRRQVEGMARAWVQANEGEARGRAICFDVVGVDLPRGEVRHHRGAFEAQGWW